MPDEGSISGPSAYATADGCGAGPDRNAARTGSAPWATTSPRGRFSTPASTAGTPEHSGLDFRIRRISPEPDRQKRLGEIIALDRSLDGAVHIHLDAHAWL